MSIINAIESAVESAVEVIGCDGMSFACEADLSYHEYFDAVMEARTLSNSERDKLPDESFGLIYKDDEGKKQRKYPLIVPNSVEISRDLQRKAVATFHFCGPKYKKDLAIAIVDAIAQTETGVSISPKSQIHIYVKVPKEMIGEEWKLPSKKKK